MVTKWPDEGNAVNRIYLLDFSTGFDSVTPQLLIALYVGVSGTLCQIPEASGGALQGSVIGPILFIIYGKGLPNRLFPNSLLYADTVKLIAPHNRHEILQSSFNVRTAARGHRILQACRTELLRCENHLGHDPLSAVLPCLSLWLGLH